MEHNYQVCLGLGSNLGNKKRALGLAISELKQRLIQVRVSNLYRTEPRDFVEQPEFLNCALTGEWGGSLFELLELCQNIEKAQGRVRGNVPRYGPRSIDIDILWVRDHYLKSSTLVVPHPRVEERAFALIPLIEIVPDAINPLTGGYLREKIALVQNQGVYQDEW